MLDKYRKRCVRIGDDEEQDRNLEDSGYQEDNEDEEPKNMVDDEDMNLDSWSFELP